MKLLQIPPAITDKVWSAVEPYLAKAVKHSNGTHSVNGAKSRVKSNAAQLWVIVEDEKPHRIVAAGITSIREYDDTNKRALMIELLGGERMSDWFELKNNIETWAAENGCTIAFCWARKGWAKHLPDFHLTHYVMTKELRP